MYLSDKLPKQNYEKDHIPLLSEEIKLLHTREPNKGFGKKNSV